MNGDSYNSGCVLSLYNLPVRFSFIKATNGYTKTSLKVEICNL